MIFSAKIFGRPFVKKNTQRVIGIGRRKRVIYSPKYLAWASMASLVCRKAHAGQETYAGLIELHLAFNFKNRQSESDLSNCIEGIQDVLQSTGVIEDDKQVRRIIASKTFGGEASTTVHLFPLEDQNA